MEDISNAYHGYKSHEEIQAYILLKFYLDYSFPSRGLLIKFVFKMLEQITASKSFEFEGEKTSFSESMTRDIAKMIYSRVLDGLT